MVKLFKSNSIAFFIMLLGFTSSFAQTLSKEFVIEYNKLCNQSISVLKKQETNYYINYSITTIKNGVFGTALENSVIINKGKIHASNMYFDFFQDTQHQIALFKDKKEIVINNASSNKVSSDYSIDKLFQLTSIDSIRKYIYSSQLIKSNKTNTLVFNFNKKYSDQFGIESLTIKYDIAKLQILQKEVVYIEQRGDKYKDQITINKIEIGTSKKAFIGSALSQVFSNSNKLKPIYKNCKIKDLRKNSLN